MAVLGLKEDSSTQSHLLLASKKDKPRVSVLATSFPIYATVTKFGNSLSLSFLFLFFFFHLPNENDGTSFMVLLKQKKAGNVG